MSLADHEVLLTRHMADRDWYDPSDPTAWPSFAQFAPVPADAAFRTGDQRAISACTKRSNFAGVRSFLGGIDPPSSATFALTPGSSRDLSSAAASWARMGFGVPLGAKIPAQMLI